MEPAFWVLNLLKSGLAQNLAQNVVGIGGAYILESFLGDLSLIYCKFGVIFNAKTCDALIDKIENAKHHVTIFLSFHFVLLLQSSIVEGLKDIGPRTANLRSKYEIGSPRGTPLRQSISESICSRRAVFRVPFLCTVNLLGFFRDATNCCLSTCSTYSPVCCDAVVHVHHSCITTYRL
jgi:hypothetical protein